MVLRVHQCTKENRQLNTWQRYIDSGVRQIWTRYVQSLNDRDITIPYTVHIQRTKCDRSPWLPWWQLGYLWRHVFAMAKEYGRSRCIRVRQTWSTLRPNSQWIVWITDIQQSCYVYIGSALLQYINLYVHTQLTLNPHFSKYTFMYESRISRRLKQRRREVMRIVLRERIATLV